ncbi:ABC transporter ATP-binding protein [Skermanella mucosa]|uniref:ABC transporter ATP-binding protein n=1 Tax=Skermanella mucosa TaxID=1789672 RepID=UPI00192B6CCD|nr:ABC transporter ATP-binding protein [Skermanella mucosa]UEM18772.1 ABC transporter ATP-binding protein [Skermanella mucosa]
MDHSYFDDRTVASRPLSLRSALRAALRGRSATWVGKPPAGSGSVSPAPDGPGNAPAAPHDVAGPAPKHAASAEEALGLDHVRHRYGGMTAVDDVSLGIARGEIMCLVGPSGCGKSTLLRVAAGLEALQHGTVRINGKVVADNGGCIPPERRGVGLVFQDYALFPHLSVIDNVRFGLSGIPVEIRRRRAMETLEQVGMAAYADHFPHALSGGQQQRVALARALAPNPAVLLLDEPFSGLDARLREQVRDETLHVLKKTGAATMLVTHDPEEAMFLADRIALMRDGKLIQLGSPVDLYTRPADAFAAQFFGEVNRIGGRVRGGAVETPLGRVPCDLPEGAAAEVLIRPEALQLSAPDTAAGARVPNLGRVMAARLLGRTSLIHLDVPDGAQGRHLHSRMPGQFLPPEDTHVAITLDMRQAFVFPAKDPT